MPETFTPTETAMLRILSDGLAHAPEELHACLPDNLGPVSNVQQHVSNIRKKLQPHGQDIVTRVVNRRCHYIHVRLLASATDGRV